MLMDYLMILGGTLFILLLVFCVLLAASFIADVLIALEEWLDKK